MNPLAHYIVDLGCLEKKLSYLDKEEERDFVCGSILNDLFLAGIFLKSFKRPFYSAKQTHNFGKKIYLENKAYIKKYSLEPVILGTLVHNEVDFLTHKEYNGGIGYIYQLSDCIVEKVAEFYNIGKYDEKKGKNKLPVAKDLAHYFAESAIDQLIAKENKKVALEIAKKIRAFTKPANYFAKAIDNLNNNNYLMNGFALHAFMGFARFTLNPYLAKLTLGLSYHVGYGKLAGFKTLHSWFNEIWDRACEEKYSYKKFLEFAIDNVNSKLTGRNIDEDIDALLNTNNY